MPRKLWLFVVSDDAAFSREVTSMLEDFAKMLLSDASVNIVNAPIQQGTEPSYHKAISCKQKQAEDAEFNGYWHYNFDNDPDELNQFMKARLETGQYHQVAINTVIHLPTRLETYERPVE